MTLEAKVLQLLDDVAKLYNINKDEYSNDLPKIIQSDRNTSYFDIKNKCIAIHPTHEDRLGIIAEECGHYLREKLVPHTDNTIHEFFGGLARLLIGGGDITLAPLNFHSETIANNLHMYLNEQELAATLQFDDQYTASELHKTYETVHELIQAAIDLQDIQIKLVNAKNKTHFDGYNFAQCAYNDGWYSKVIDRNLIRLPDKKVERAIRSYILPLSQRIKNKLTRNKH